MWDRDLRVLAKQIGTWRRSKGFMTPATTDTQRERDLLLGKLMLVVTEVAEAAEAVRHSDRENLAEELADATIRILDITEAQGIDLLKEIHKKMEINQQRPHLHGKTTTL